MIDTAKTVLRGTAPDAHVPIRFARKLLPQEGSDPNASHASETHHAYHIRRR